MELPSGFQIGDECEFIPTFKQHTEMGIAPDERDGKVVAVRFTEAKVFYDVFDTYYAKVFENIPSEKVFKSAWADVKPSPEPLPEKDIEKI